MKLIIAFVFVAAVLVYGGCTNSTSTNTYTVTYNGNGNTGGNVPIDSTGYEQGATVTVMGNNGNLVKTGYTFAGWNTASDGSGTDYAAGTIFTMGNADVTLYAQWAGPGYQETYTADGVSFPMSYVPEGYTFPTGTNDLGTPSTVNDAYWIGETEVTYELWYKVYTWATTGSLGTGAGQYTFANPGTEGDDGTAGDPPTSAAQEPVTTINWRDSMVWCNALTEWYNANDGTSYTCVYKDGGTPIRDSRDANAAQCDGVTPDNSATGFRLLTSDEWELAARWRGDSTNTVSGYTDPYFTKGNSASGATADYNDEAPTRAVAWYIINSGSSTHAAKGKTANSLGLYDMSGNVWEWCFDLSGIDRVERGGSWYGFANALHVGHVDSIAPHHEDYSLGFRFARTP